MNNEYMYAKSMDEPLNFIECVQLLDRLAKEGCIQRDPNNRNNILVYRSGGPEKPAGWHSDNLMSVASEVVNNVDDQKFLRKTLAENGVEMVFDGSYKFAEEIMSILAGAKNDGKEQQTDAPESNDIAPEKKVVMTLDEAYETITNAVQTEKMTAEQDKALYIAQNAIKRLMPAFPKLDKVWYAGVSGYFVNSYLCPRCECGLRKNENYHDSFCPNCGQAIEWSDET